MITVADTRILDPNTGEVLAFPGDVLDDEQPRRQTYLEALLALPRDEQEIIFQSIDEGVPFQQAVIAFYQLKAIVG